MNRWTIALRTALVVATTAAASVPLALVARPPLAVLAEAASHGSAGVGSVTLAHLVAGLCATALLGCYAVWLLGLLLTLLEALPHGVAPAAVRRVSCPRLARALAASALGASLAVASPASADAPGDAGHATPAGGPAAPLATGAALAGLPLPDRVTTPGTARTRAAAREPHQVVPGDTLWAIAESHLPTDAPAASHERAWRPIAAANPDGVADPHLIFPGTVQRGPPLDDLLGKDQP